jgi:L-amino acid N-acyltransferase YncA
MIDIRLVHLTEADQLRDLRREALVTDPIAFVSTYEAEKAHGPAWYIGLLKQNVVIGAFVDGVLRGMSVMTQNGNEKQFHKAYTWFTYVSPEFRGMGLARGIRVFTFEEAKRRGISNLMSAVLSTNEPIRKLNKSLGCEEMYTEKNAIKHDGVFHDLIHTVKYV